MPLQEGMLGGGPKARQVLEGENQNAEAIKGLQGAPMLRGDVGNGLGDGHRNVGENEPNQNPVDGAGRRLPAAPVLQDLERALAESQPFRPVVHRWSPAPADTQSRRG